MTLFSPYEPPVVFFGQQLRRRLRDIKTRLSEGEKQIIIPVPSWRVNPIPSETASGVVSPYFLGVS